MSWNNFSFQPMRFALSGGVATTTHWLVMAVMLSSGIEPSVATASGALIGAIVNYFLQRNITFQSKARHRSALVRYAGVCTLTWFANLVIFIVLYHIILLTPMYAQGITTFLVALISYVLYKRIVFNDQHTRPVYQA